MSAEDLVDQLRRLGFEVTVPQEGFAVFPFLVQTGQFAGQTIKIGVEGTDGFPLHPPKTVHVSPRLYPQRPEHGPHPTHGIHESALGAEWQYWSRPIQRWRPGQGNAGDLLAHIRALLDHP